MASNAWIDYSVKLLKLLAYVIVFAVVLGSAVIAKGTLLFVSSQLKKGRQISHCNKALGEIYYFKFYIIQMYIFYQLFRA